MSEKIGKTIVLIVGLFDGHIPGAVGLVKDLISLGHNVSCYVLDKFEDRLKQTGAKIKVFTVGKIELNPNCPEKAYIGALFSKFYDLILTEAQKSQEKYDYLICDSFFDGNEISKIFKIPKYISLYIFPVGKMTSLGSDTLVQRLSYFFIPINKKFNLNIRDFLAMHYKGDAKYKLMLTSKLFHIETNALDDSFYFIGPYIEERPTDNKFNFKKDENKKLIYISLGTIFNKNIDFYKKCIEIFGNSKQFQVIISIGKSINVKDLGDLPENISAFNFVPQHQVLKQSDIFITHGGINSINEAILLNNLPLIVIPQEMDQNDNAKQIENFEAGIALDKNNITAEIINNSILKILDNEEKYKNGVKKIAQSFKEASAERKKILEKIII